MKYLQRFERFQLDKLKELIEKEKIYANKSEKQPSLLNSEQYRDILNVIRSYDISNFIYNITPYGVFIKPDKNFKQIISELNNTILPKISEDFEISLSIDKEKCNQIDFDEGIPDMLRGIGLGFKIYKLMIKKFKFLSSNRYSNKFAYNIWYNLMLDEDLYCFGSYFYAGVILKDISNDELKGILEIIKELDVIYDEELEEKIIELYGSVDIYKQKNK